MWYCRWTFFFSVGCSTLSDSSWVKFSLSPNWSNLSSWKSAYSDRGYSPWNPYKTSQWVERLIPRREIPIRFILWENRWTRFCICPYWTKRWPSSPCWRSIQCALNSGMERNPEEWRREWDISKKTLTRPWSLFWGFLMTDERCLLGVDGKKMTPYNRELPCLFSKSRNQRK